MGTFSKIKTALIKTKNQLVKFWKGLNSTLKSISVVLGIIVAIFTQIEKIEESFDRFKNRDKLSPELITKLRRIEADSLSQSEINELLLECGSKKDGLDYILIEFESMDCVKDAKVSVIKWLYENKNQYDVNEVLDEVMQKSNTFFNENIDIIDPKQTNADGIVNYIELLGEIGKRDTLKVSSQLKLWEKAIDKQVELNKIEMGISDLLYFHINKSIQKLQH